MYIFVGLEIPLQELVEYYCIFAGHFRVYIYYVRAEIKQSRMKYQIYLDNCCFNRPYDDQSYLLIQLESEAKLFVQKEILKGRFELVWSYYFGL